MTMDVICFFMTLPCSKGSMIFDMSTSESYLDVIQYILSESF